MNIITKEVFISGFTNIINTLGKKIVTQTLGRALCRKHTKEEEQNLKGLYYTPNHNCLPPNRHGRRMRFTLMTIMVVKAYIRVID